MGILQGFNLFSGTFGSIHLAFTATGFFFSKKLIKHKFTIHEKIAP